MVTSQAASSSNTHETYLNMSLRWGVWLCVYVRGLSLSEDRIRHWQRSVILRYNLMIDKDGHQIDQFRYNKIHTWFHGRKHTKTMHYSLLSLKRISFVLFPQLSLAAKYELAIGEITATDWVKIEPKIQDWIKPNGADLPEIAISKNFTWFSKL